MFLTIEEKSEVPELLLEAVRGDNGSLGKLLLLHRRAIRAVAVHWIFKHRTLHPAGVDAYLEDYIQSVYVDAVAAFPVFDPVHDGRSTYCHDPASKFTAWIIRLAQFALKNRIEPGYRRITITEALVEPFPGGDEGNLRDRSDSLAVSSWVADHGDDKSPLPPETVCDPRRSRYTRVRASGTGSGRHRTPERAAEIREHREAFMAQATGQ